MDSASVNYIHLKKPKKPFNFLWLFGESPQDLIVLVFHVEPAPRDGRSPLGSRLTWNEEQLPAEEIQRAEQLFPEAAIQYRLYGSEPKN